MVGVRGLRCGIKQVLSICVHRGDSEISVGNYIMLRQEKEVVLVSLKR